MADRVITGQYDFDPQGNNPDNSIIAERHTLVVPGIDDYFFIIPFASPFFVDSLLVMNDSNGVPYVEGTDYAIGHYFVEAMQATGRAIAGSIRFLRRDITGIVRLNYHTLGGAWGFDDNAILEELANRQYNPLVRSWGMIDALPATFPPLPHDQQVDDLVGTEEILAGLESIANAIEAAGEGSTSGHISDTNNPHNVTRAQVGLSQVQNYPVATQLQAETGTSNSVYMTALRVAQAINALANGPLTTHINNNNNPHNVTKAQVGLSLVPNYSAATDIEATDGARNDRFMTPYTTALLLQSQGATALINSLQNAFNTHANNFNNPHNVTAAQVGTYTSEQIDQLLATVVAGDALTFDGLTPEDWRESLPSIANVTAIIDKIRIEYIQALTILSGASPTLTQNSGIPIPVTVKAGYDHYVITFTNNRVIDVTGGISLGVDLTGNSDVYTMREDAAYCVTSDGYIRNVGSASISPPAAYNELTPTPPTNVPVQLAAMIDRVFAVLSDGSLYEFTSSSGAIIDSDVAAVYVGMNNTNRRIVLYNGGTAMAYGEFDFGAVMNTVLSPLTNIVDITIGDEEIFVLMDDGTVLGWSCVLSVSNYIVTPLSLPSDFSTDIEFISGCSDHFVFVDVTGTLRTRGDNSNGQLNFNLPGAVYRSASAGVGFTVTLDMNNQVHFWGRTPDNHLNPPASFKGVS